MARLKAPERRRELLEVAARLFGERGYHGTTTADLAATAGVTEPILYRHFASKLDLFVSLVDEVGAEVLAAWRERLEACDESALVHRGGEDCGAKLFASARLPTASSVGDWPAARWSMHSSEAISIAERAAR